MLQYQSCRSGGDSMHPSDTAGQPGFLIRKKGSESWPATRFPHWSRSQYAVPRGNKKKKTQKLSNPLGSQTVKDDPLLNSHQLVSTDKCIHVIILWVFVRLMRQHQWQTLNIQIYIFNVYFTKIYLFTWSKTYVKQYNTSSVLLSFFLYGGADLSLSPLRSFAPPFLLLT